MAPLISLNAGESAISQSNQAALSRWHYVDASVFYAAGFVTGTDGNANIVARVNAGSLAAGIDVLIPGGLTAGNGLAAEIHLVVRSHGSIIPGRVDEQIGSFDGACDVNASVDQQAAAFLPAG
jgi:hypothetical protein